MSEFWTTFDFDMHMRPEGAIFHAATPKAIRHVENEVRGVHEVFGEDKDLWFIVYPLRAASAVANALQKKRFRIMFILNPGTSWPRGLGATKKRKGRKP